MGLEIDEAIGIEVAHADGSYLTFTIRTLHSSVRTIVIAERLMDQEQVNIVGLELLQTFEDGGISLLFARISDPDLRHYEEFGARHATLGDGLTYTLFILIGLSRIDHPVAYTDGIQDTALSFLRIDLVYAIAQLRHLHTII